MRDNRSKKISIVTIIVTLMASVSFGIITDDFETAQDYLTDLSDTIWDQASISNGASATQDGVLNVLNTSDTPGVLTINSSYGHFYNANDDGFLLYQVIPAGDFAAQVKVVGGDMHSFNGGTDRNHPVGLMARSITPKESFNAVRMLAYDHWQWNVTHTAISHTNGTQSAPGINLEEEGGVGTYPWLRLERVGNVFNTYYGPDVAEPNESDWILHTSFTRDDLVGELQVGLCQHTGAGTWTIEFDHFSLDAGPIPYAPMPKCDAGIYDPTVGVLVDSSLSWAAPSDPNLAQVISYDVFMDPNEADVLAGDPSVQVADGINVTFCDPGFELANDTQYFWRVEATVAMDDPNQPGDTETLSSALWTFMTEPSNYPPQVDAGDDMMTWSGEPVVVDATVIDDGVTTAAYLWTVVPDGSEDPNFVVTITDPTVEDPEVTITNAYDTMATFTLTLTVDDGVNAPVEDSMTIDVYRDACQMTRLGAGVSYQTDLNDDCVMNLLDFAEMAAVWLDDYSVTGPVDK